MRLGKMVVAFSFAGVAALAEEPPAPKPGATQKTTITTVTETTAAVPLAPPSTEEPKPKPKPEPMKGEALEASIRLESANGPMSLVLSKSIPLNQVVYLRAKLPPGTVSATAYLWRSWRRLGPGQENTCAPADGLAEPTNVAPADGLSPKPPLEPPLRLAHTFNDGDIRAHSGIRSDQLPDEMLIQLPELTEPWWTYCLQAQIWRAMPGVKMTAGRVAAVVDLYDAELESTGAIPLEEMLAIGRSQQLRLFPTCDQPDVDTQLACEQAALVVAEKLRTHGALVETLRARRDLRAKAKDLREKVLALGVNTSIPTYGELVHLYGIERYSEAEAEAEGEIAGDEKNLATELLLKNESRSDARFFPADAELYDDGDVTRLVRNIAAYRRAQRVDLFSRLRGDIKLFCAGKPHLANQCTLAEASIQRTQVSAQLYEEAMKQLVVTVRLGIITSWTASAAQSTTRTTSHVDRAKGFFSTDIGIGPVFFGNGTPPAVMSYVQLSAGFIEADFSHGLGEVVPPKQGGKDDSWVDYAAWWFGQRITISSGFAFVLNAPRTERGQIQGIFGSNTPLLTAGVGFRFTEFVKLTGGMTFGTVKGPGPASADIVPGAFLGLSLDLPVYRAVGYALQPAFAPGGVLARPAITTETP